MCVGGTFTPYGQAGGAGEWPGLGFLVGGVLVVVAVVVVGVVGGAEAPVAAGYQRAGRAALAAQEVLADAAHGRRLAGHPDPRAVGDGRVAGGVVQFGAPGVRS